MRAKAPAKKPSTKPTRRAPPGLVASRFEVAGERFAVFRLPKTPALAAEQLARLDSHSHLNVQTPPELGE